MAAPLQSAMSRGLYDRLRRAPPQWRGSRPARARDSPAPTAPGKSTRCVEQRGIPQADGWATILTGDIDVRDIAYVPRPRISPQLSDFGVDFVAPGFGASVGFF